MPVPCRKNQPYINAAMDTSPPVPDTVCVINGPNLNLLGIREPEIYGSSSLDDIEQLCCNTCQQHNWVLHFTQSNHEGDLVDAIHQAGALQQVGQLVGVVLNAAAYTHTSVALLDAIKSTNIPVIELHISNVFAREPFRHKSWIAPVARAVICGFGIQGYKLAIEGLKTWQNQQ